jgi:hypothetical protein
VRVPGRPGTHGSRGKPAQKATIEDLSSHAETCRCGLHQQIEQRVVNLRRHASYRQLAFAILGPSAPREDAALANALADHARLLRVIPSNLADLTDLQAA